MPKSFIGLTLGVNIKHKYEIISRLIYFAAFRAGGACSFLVPCCSSTFFSLLQVHSKQLPASLKQLPATVEQQRLEQQQRHAALKVLTSRARAQPRAEPALGL